MIPSQATTQQREKVINVFSNVRSAQWDFVREINFWKQVKIDFVVDVFSVNLQKTSRQPNGFFILYIIFM